MTFKKVMAAGMAAVLSLSVMAGCSKEEESSGQ